MRTLNFGEVSFVSGGGESFLGNIGSDMATLGKQSPSDVFLTGIGVTTNLITGAAGLLIGLPVGVVYACCSMLYNGTRFVGNKVSDGYHYRRLIL